ncbi:DUF862-domain-containing protein [Ascobolus immersus RN42]|uniref:DUF862-domain-containing protein n=1 Tax=Ascobolus immersus RN42 TaxID=1160509 RepID=A0A3N4HNK5_ASCIM|nr:DUF862-domain-containing protein [Ascobolus immersus RN42]
MAKGTSQHSRHRSRASTQKTSVLINVYDLLPPGRLTTFAWALGCSLLHSGVVINDREYAFGGHDRPRLTGVYHTKPRHERPGATFRCELLHGFTMATPEEIENIIREASDAFPGTSYNLLTKNCNHFTSYLCEKLTGKPAPAYINRAANIGVALPCIVPQEWVDPGECEDGLDDENARLVENWSPDGSPRVGTAVVGVPSGSSLSSTESLSRSSGWRDSDNKPLPKPERAPLA